MGFCKRAVEPRALRRMKRPMNSLECVEYVSRVGVVSEVEFHICCCPPVWPTRLYKLGQKGGEEMLKMTVYENIFFIFYIIPTFSTRSIKKSLTSFVLVNFAAILTRPLERFCSLKEKSNYYFVIHNFIYLLLLSLSSQKMAHMITWSVPFPTLKLASISANAFVFPLRAVQTKLSAEQNRCYLTTTEI